MSLRRKGMSPPGVHYRNIPADDGGIQPLELESGGPERQHDSLTRQTFLRTAAGLIALLLLIVGIGVHKKGGTDTSANIRGGEPEADTPNQAQTQTKPKIFGKEGDELWPIDPPEPGSPKFVFCYGDSLTYGMSDLHASGAATPYAKYLWAELNQTMKQDVVVQHVGMPGWTAENMLHHLHDRSVGICSILHSMRTLSLMIILVGTNDIGHMTDSSKQAARNIVESIVALHKGAFECAETERNEGFHILALGIPESAFQARVPVTAENAEYINNAMKAFAASYPDDKLSYLDFPIPYNEDDGNWGSDGIHLTQEGYEKLSKEIAPSVKSILENIP